MPKIVRRILTAIAVLILALGPALGFAPWTPAPTARAFDPRVHVAMFQETLGSRFSADAQEAVTDGLEYADSASVGILTDPLLAMFTRVGPGQGHPEWHFDNAKNAAELCDRWNDFEAGTRLGPDKLLSDTAAYAVEAFKQDPFDPAGLDRVGGFRRVALFHYGVYLHAVQDFYSHTNWIELHAAAGKRAGVAPIQAGCDDKALAELQPKLQSGYFNMNADNIDFCDYQYIFGTYHLPAGFDYCHGPAEFTWQARFLSALKPSQMLAKDSAHHFHGGEALILPDGTETTYHQEARRLATLATAETYAVLHNRVVTRFKAQLPDRDPECLFQVLVQGGDPACPKRTGQLYQTDTPLLGENSWDWTDFTNRVVTPSVATFDIAITVDPTTNRILGGTLAIEAVDPEARERCPDCVVATKKEGTVNVQLAGVLGAEPVLIQFDGAATHRTANGASSVSQGTVADFHAVFDAGRLVLCRGYRFNSYAPDHHQECVANAHAVLDPVPEPAATT